MPANQEFVYVHRLVPEEINISKLLISNSEFNKPISSQQQQKHLNMLTTPSATPSADLDTKLFRKFVFEHIRTALSDGFNDNIGRTNVPPVFELATADTWYKVYEALADYFLGDAAPKNSKLASYYVQLKSQIDLDTQFSENRCKKLLQPALGLYQENLPSHYNKIQHQQRVIEIF